MGHNGHTSSQVSQALLLGEVAGEGASQRRSKEAEVTRNATRGVLYIHSAPSALCPHVEWAVGGVLGVPVSLEWTPQAAQAGTYRAEHSWSGDAGTAAA